MRCNPAAFGLGTLPLPLCNGWAAMHIPHPTCYTSLMCSALLPPPSVAAANVGFFSLYRWASMAWTTARSGLTMCGCHETLCWTGGGLSSCTQSQQLQKNLAPARVFYMMCLSVSVLLDVQQLACLSPVPSPVPAFRFSSLHGYWWNMPDRARVCYCSG